MRLVAAIVVKEGKVLALATNEHTTPCKREGYPTGVGYELCEECNYPNHAEYKACLTPGIEGATLFLFGHYYACEPCKAAMEKAGVKLTVQ